MVANLKFQVSSVNKYDPPLDVVAARNHMTHLVYQLMQPQVLYDRLVQIYCTVLFNILSALFLNAKLTAPIKTASWNEVIQHNSKEIGTFKSGY